jgi:hypothetical protein
MLSDADVVRIQAATFLTLCAAISQGGQATLEDISAALLSHVEDMECGAWVEVIRALAAVLERDGRWHDVKPPPTPQQPLRVIEGGLKAPVRPM